LLMLVDYKLAQAAETCGLQAAGHEPTGVGGVQRSFRWITHGNEAKPHSWPWAAQFFYQDEFYAGGTLIGQKWLLAAGHSVYPRQNDLNRIRIKLGVHRSGLTSKPNEQTQQVMQVANAFVHPKFNYVTHDVALIKFTENANINENVSPICLPNKGEKLQDNEQVVTIGFGLTDKGFDADALQQVVLSVIPFETCQKIYQNTDIAWDDKTVICAGKGGAIGSCAGDSGSALMARRNGTWTQFGLTHGGQGDCATKQFPGTYSYVPELLDWILDTIEKNP